LNNRELFALTAESHRFVERFVMSTNPFFENISFSRSFTDQVKFIVKDLFFNTGIKYFIYLRGSLDGSVSALFSHGDFFLDLLEKGTPY
jgi:hypothetical protein